MLCKITIPFVSSKGLHYNFYSSSLMQGVMMENIPPFYAEKMHKEGLRPYSQFCTFENGRNLWIISSLNSEAAENIIRPVSSIEKAEVRYKKDIITFQQPTVERMSYEKLLAENAVKENGTEKITLRIITPTAFKSSGNYVILPTIRLIFQSLSKRFDCFFGISGNDYEALAEEAEKNIRVTDYSLSGSDFALEGVRIPSFTGSITFTVKGDKDFRSYIRMLCRFSEFSGLGIKTAIGMGQIKADF